MAAPISPRPTRHPQRTDFSQRPRQYGSSADRKVLVDAGMSQSMSARANPYHNAWTESFMGTLKTEMLGDDCLINDADARTEIFDFIE